MGGSFVQEKFTLNLTPENPPATRVAGAEQGYLPEMLLLDLDSPALAFRLPPLAQNGVPADHSVHNGLDDGRPHTYCHILQRGSER